jgi:hypothetical protein
VSALPEHFMRAPDNPGQERTQPDPHEQDVESGAEADDNFTQWVALVVLLACWLAEAYL